jgi:AcrR family transcriptional regulator
VAKKTRTPLSRERVLRAAVALADEGGIDALSMRRLGQELGVEAMSLYNHVANKDDLLSGILDVALSEIELPDDALHWKAALRLHAVSAHAALRRHPWACRLALSPSPDRVLSVMARQMEWKLGRLREGLPEQLTYHGLHALDSHILGFTLWELSHNITAENVGDLAARFLRMFPADVYPLMYEHVEQHMTGFDRETNAFEFGLDLILEGLERLHEADSGR